MTDISVTSSNFKIGCCVMYKMNGRNTTILWEVGLFEQHSSEIYKILLQPDSWVSPLFIQNDGEFGWINFMLDSNGLDLISMCTAT